MDRMFLVLLLCFIFSVKFTYAVEVGEEFQIQINYEDFTCKKKDPYHSYYYDDYQPKKPCTLEDFIPCQADFITTTLETGNIFASYIYCEALETVIACNEKVLYTCEEANDRQISKTIEEMRQQMYFMEQNCLCNNTEDHYSECADPCKAKPCLNGGECKLVGMETTTADYYDYYYYSDVKKEFEECQCQTPYSGEFCQNCETCQYTCKTSKVCTCPNKEYAGPFCNIPCGDVKSERVSLFRSCVQVAVDLYFLYPQPSGCVLAMALHDCVAASLNHCGVDLTHGLKDYNMLETYQRLSGRLLAQRCIVFGKPPFII